MIDLAVFSILSTSSNIMSSAHFNALSAIERKFAISGLLNLFSMALVSPWKKYNHGMLPLLNIHDTVHIGQGSYLTSFIKQPSQ